MVPVFIFDVIPNFIENPVSVFLWIPPKSGMINELTQ